MKATYEQPDARELVDRSRVLVSVMLENPDEVGPNFVIATNFRCSMMYLKKQKSGDSEMISCHYNQLVLPGPFGNTEEPRQSVPVVIFGDIVRYPVGYKENSSKCKLFV